LFFKGRREGEKRGIKPNSTFLSFFQNFCFINLAGGFVPAIVKRGKEEKKKKGKRKKSSLFSYQRFYKI